jgi:extracellular factor (EF) 3-hydroxypalmitic acid methyl ester biosynthesis protein
MSSRRPSSGPPSPRHEDLNGASGASVRFRPSRLDGADIPSDLECHFECDGVFVGPLAILDLSAAGFGLARPSQIVLAPGSTLESFELRLGDRTIWTGSAVVVHGSEERVGGRFTSGVVDLHRLRLGITLDGRMALLREQRERLPAEWRAAVADVRQLLEDVRAELDEIERSEAQDPLHRRDDEAKLFEALRARWGAAFYASLSQLHEMSKALDPRQVALGRSYASSMLMPLLMACPMHRRAYEKPLGYSGDYRMMELYFAEELTGDGLYGRFLHSIAQNYTLGLTVVAREAIMREAVRAAVETEGDGPVRVLALAAGPAIELRRFLEATGPLSRPVELILLDQDRAAHEVAHRHLTRILLERQHGTLPVRIRCLHSSVRQLLRPETPDDEQVVGELLAGLDLVYSAGLYDYLPEPVAVRLTSFLYSRLRPGGRVLVGNLVDTPDTTWIIDYVCGWTLLYRTDETMLRLAEGLTPTPSRTTITRDATGRCLFLDVTSPRE